MIDYRHMKHKKPEKHIGTFSVPVDIGFYPKITIPK